MILCDRNDNVEVIVLRPNQSWTWRANVYLIASIAVISITVGVTLTLQGYWLILPFTALELLVLTWCMAYCVRKTQRQEVLRLSRERLIFERGVKQPSERINVQRFFARFLFRPSAARRGPEVALRCNGQETEIGSFLSDEEKTELAGLLRRTIDRLDRA